MKTIKFYNIAIFKNDQKTNIDMLPFFDQIDTVAWENRVRKINDNITAAFPMSLNSNHVDKRIIPIGKFRVDYKPFIGSIDTSSLQIIKNDVVELVTLVYDQTYKTAIIDYNREGLKVKDIEEYLSSFLPITEDARYEVKMIQIVPSRTTEDVYRSEQIRCVEIKLKLNSTTRNIINNCEYDNNAPTVLGFLSNLGGMRQEIDASTVKLELGVGSARNATMALDTVKQLLRIINIDDESVEYIKVRYRNSRSEKIDTLNLKNTDIQLTDRIFEGESIINPVPEHIGNTVIEICGDYESTLLESNRIFIQDMIDGNMPRIRSIPMEMHMLE